VRGFAPLLTPLLVVAVLFAPAASAQRAEQKLQAEGRIDGIFSSATAVHAGVGLSVPAGLYVRTGIVLGAGIGRYGFDSRADLIGRFSFDPLRQSRWAPYGGAGVSARFNSTADGDPKGYLLFFVGMEGPVPRGRPAAIVPAFELGLGGGARVGIILRRGVHARR
jgi:hypothetical protein